MVIPSEWGILIFLVSAKICDGRNRAKLFSFIQGQQD